MLVEDNELNSEIATEILTEYGFIVDTAENGAEALEGKYFKARYLRFGVDGCADAYYEWV